MNEYLQKDYNLNKIFRKIKGDGNNEKVEIVLPFFQREFKWSPKQQKEMLASFLLKIPIGSFLLIKGEKEEYKNKMIGFKSESVELDSVKKDCLYLLDGQQRITSLYTMFNDYIMELKSKVEDSSSFSYRTVEKELRNRWYLNFNPKDEPIKNNIFGLKYLSFNKDELYKKEPSDIMDYLVYKNVKISKDNEWYHPFNDGYETHEYFTPLFSIYDYFNNNCQKFEYSLEDISEKIVRKMMNLDGYEHEELWNEIFKEKFLRDKTINEDVFKSEFVENDKIKETFTKVSLEWCRDIQDYFKERLKEYELSVFQLSKNEINRAITIFEHMNLGGVKLDTFDLIVAKSAKDMEESLIDHMYKIQEELESDMNFKFKKMNIFDSGKQYNSSRVKEQFLNILSILNRLEGIKNSDINEYDKIVESLKIDSIKKKQILAMNSKDISDYYEIAFNSLLKSFGYINLNFGIKKVTDISYILMLLPISLILSEYKSIEDIDVEIDKKVKYWYWVSLFSGRYNSRQNRVAINDVIDLYKWCFIDKNHRFLENAEAQSKVLNSEDYSKFKTLITDDCPKALKRSIYQYILSKSPTDLYGEIDLKMNDIISEKIKVEKHHIITKKKFENMGIDDSAIINTPLNITPTLRETNNDISDKDFVNYVGKLKEIKDQEDKGNYLRDDHFIETAKLYNLDNLEDIEGFYKDRFTNLKDNINSYLTDLIS